MSRYSFHSTRKVMGKMHAGMLLPTGLKRWAISCILVCIYLSLHFIAWAQPAVSGRVDYSLYEQPDTIVIATSTVQYRAAFEEIGRRYEELHPHIDIKWSFISQDYGTWIRTRFAAGGDLVPDIYNGNYTFGYDRLGKWVVLDKYLESVNPYTGQFWLDTFDTNLVERYRSIGNYYLVPLEKVGVAIFYNKDMFNRLGLEIPADWNAFIKTCKLIEEAGYIPIAMAGDAEGFWSGEMGWLVRILTDAYLRDQIHLIASQPGDWDYNLNRDTSLSIDSYQTYSDAMFTINTEREINAVLEGEIDFTSDRFANAYRRIKQLSAYFQPGYMGTSGGENSIYNANTLFYQQKAAMCLMHSGYVSQLIYDFEQMNPEDRFAFGNFALPSIKDDPLCPRDFRQPGGGGTLFVVSEKNDKSHERNVVDFLMFLTSPQSGQIIVDETLRERQPLMGPPAIRGVHLPGDLQDKYKVFTEGELERISYRGFQDEQESIAEWVVATQEYFSDRLSLNEYLKRYQQIMLDAARRQVERFGYDLDPRTNDPIPAGPAALHVYHPLKNGMIAIVILLVLYALYSGVQVLRSRKYQRSFTRNAYLLLLPTFVLLILFNYYPALSALYHSFTYWHGGQEAEFSGLENFRRMQSDPAFLKGMINMVLLMIAALFKNVVVPFIAAQLILAVKNQRMRYFFRTFFMIPLVVPTMVVILLWRYIYSPSGGLLNQLLAITGLDVLQSNWLGEYILALPSIMFMGFPWVGTLGLIIFMAGLLRIPRALSETYQLESTNVLRRMWVQDIPMVRGQLGLMIVLTVIASLQDFQTVMILTNGGPGMATTVPALRMFHVAFRFGDYGYGAAIGFVLFILILGLAIIQMKLFKAEEPLS